MKRELINRMRNGLLAAMPAVMVSTGTVRADVALPFAKQGVAADPNATFKITNTGTGDAIWGESTNTDYGVGVLGTCAADYGAAVRGEHSSGAWGELAGGTAWVEFPNQFWGARAFFNNNQGYLATQTAGVKGHSVSGSGVWARSTNSWGLHVNSTNSTAIKANSNGSTTILAEATTGTVLDAKSAGSTVLRAACTNTGTDATNGVYSTNSSSAGRGGLFLATHATGNNYGVRAETSSRNGTAGYFLASSMVPSGTRYGIFAGANPLNYANSYAGYFYGKVHVNGTLSKSAGSFKIDHPLDPENKTLSHSFVESPDMMNIYNGNIVTGEDGYATIVMPDWFEALNTDFRYQLTVIDSADSDDFVQVKVVHEIEENSFGIRTSTPNVKVSWQVTGVRQDAYAKAHRIPVEELKASPNRGKFLTPDVFGKPESLSIAAIDFEAEIDPRDLSLTDPERFETLPPRSTGRPDSDGDDDGSVDDLSRRLNTGDRGR